VRGNQHANAGRIGNRQPLDVMIDLQGRRGTDDGMNIRRK
jgi:hypothetical protein